MTRMKDTCKWVPIEHFEDMWRAECGPSLFLTTPTPLEMGMHFCPFCGRLLISDYGSNAPVDGIHVEYRYKVYAAYEEIILSWDEVRTILGGEDYSICTRDDTLIKHLICNGAPARISSGNVEANKTEWKIVCTATTGTL